MDLEDAHNQVRVHQRKNASSLKDLTKQLQHYRKYVCMSLPGSLCMYSTYIPVGVSLRVSVRVTLYVHTCWGGSLCVYLLGSLCMYILVGGLCVCIC